METTTAPTRTLRRIRNAGTMLLVVVFLTIAASACQPAGCGTNCVKSLTMNPGANQVVVTTTVATFVHVDIYADGDLTNLVATKSDPGIGTTHTIAMAQLSPATVYYWRVTASDANNLTHSTVGTLKTDARQVTVHLDRIKMTNDSDDLGDGEMSFHLSITGQNFWNVYTNEDFATGQDLKNLGIVETMTSSPSTLGIRVMAVDDDCEAQLCVNGLPNGFDNGSNADNDWSTATFGPIALPSQNGSGSWTASVNNVVGFQAWGTYDVTYSSF